MLILITIRYFRQFGLPEYKNLAPKKDLYEVVFKCERIVFKSCVCQTSVQYIISRFTPELAVNMALHEASLSLDTHYLRPYFQMETNTGIFWSEENIFTKVL